MSTVWFGSVEMSGESNNNKSIVKKVYASFPIQCYMQDGNLNSDKINK